MYQLTKCAADALIEFICVNVSSIQHLSFHSGHRVAHLPQAIIYQAEAEKL